MKRSEFSVALTTYICKKIGDNRLEDAPSYYMLLNWITEFMLDNPID